MHSVMAMRTVRALAAFPRHTFFVPGKSAGELTSRLSGDHGEISSEIDY
jgi:hypothetical protein